MCRVEGEMSLLRTLCVTYSSLKTFISSFPVALSFHVLALWFFPFTNQATTLSASRPTHLAGTRKSSHRLNPEPKTEPNKLAMEVKGTCYYHGVPTQTKISTFPSESCTKYSTPSYPTILKIEIW
jgi:hypothetical protein